MLRTGLVSVTFRQLTPEAIVDLVVESGLESIEWGGDIHVPHGNLAQARRVRGLTEQAGLRIAGYGSYYRVGHGEPIPFEDIVATAHELGASVIRVWAGKQGSATADAAYWERVVHDSYAIAETAAQAGTLVAYEFHGNTLTDRSAAARKLLEAVGHENLKTYWQPVQQEAPDTALDGLISILPWLVNVHVFAWEPTTEGQAERMPLASGEARWRTYLSAIAASGREHTAMIEFVRGDAPAQFLADAATLRHWIADLSLKGV